MTTANPSKQDPSKSTKRILRGVVVVDGDERKLYQPGEEEELERMLTQEQCDAFIANETLEGEWSGGGEAQATLPMRNSPEALGKNRGTRGQRPVPVSAREDKDKPKTAPHAGAKTEPPKTEPPKTDKK